MKLFSTIALAAVLSSAFGSASYATGAPAGAVVAAPAAGDAINKKYTVDFLSKKSKDFLLKEQTRVEQAAARSQADYLRFLAAKMNITQVLFDLRKKNADSEVAAYETRFTQEEKAAMDAFKKRMEQLDVIVKSLPGKQAAIASQVTQRDSEDAAAQSARDAASSELATKEAEETQLKADLEAATKTLMDRKAKPEQKKAAQEAHLTANVKLGELQDLMAKIDVRIEAANAQAATAQQAKAQLSRDLEACNKESEDAGREMTNLSGQRSEAARKIIERISAADMGMNAEQLAAHKAALTGVPAAAANTPAAASAVNNPAASAPTAATPAVSANTPTAGDPNTAATSGGVTPAGAPIASNQ